MQCGAWWIVAGALACAGIAWPGCSGPSATHKVAWSYTGATGPKRWEQLSPRFALCGAGREQSPIDLLKAGREPEKLPRLSFNYAPTRIQLEHDGHTIRLVYDGGSTLAIGAALYDLKELHFHAPSEHTLDGERLPLEMHLVHVDEGGRYAVVAVLFRLGGPNTALAPLWERLPAGPGERVQDADATFDPLALLPVDAERFRYTGSLTTPPCDEGVHWNVLAEPAMLSRTQLEAFTGVVAPNARPLQPHGIRLPQFGK